MRKIFLALALLAPILLGNIHTVATITGAGAAVAIVPGAQYRAAYIQCVAPSTNTNNVYFGDSTVTSTSGIPIAPGGGYNTPVTGTPYSLSATYVYISNSDVANCAWGD
jgi:hypothetical protein